MTYYYSTGVYSDSGSGAVPQYFIHPEGIVVYENGTTPVYNYFKTDHLGSTRVVLEYRNSEPRLISEFSYYPSGLPAKEITSSPVPFRYSGKQMYDGIGKIRNLGLYDFHK